MSFEADLTNLLEPLVGGRVWWDTMPEGMTIDANIIILQTVGGKAEWYIDRTTPKSHRNMRIQVSAWGLRRIEINDLMRSIEDAIREWESIPAEPLGAFTSMHESERKLYGARQDYAFWYPSP